MLVAHMLFFLVVVVVTVVVVIFLRAVRLFFFQYGIAERLGQIQGQAPLFARLLQYSRHPVIRLTADVNEKVTVRHGQNILRRRLVVMQVGAAVKQQGQFYGVLPVTQQFPRPVVFRVGGTNHRKRSALSAVARGAAGGKRQAKQEYKA